MEVFLKGVSTVTAVERFVKANERQLGIRNVKQVHQVDCYTFSEVVECVQCLRLPLHETLLLAVFRHYSKSSVWGAGEQHPAASTSDAELAKTLRDDSNTVLSETELTTVSCASSELYSVLCCYVCFIRSMLVYRECTENAPSEAISFRYLAGQHLFLKMYSLQLTSMAATDFQGFLGVTSSSLSADQIRQIFRHYPDWANFEKRMARLEKRLKQLPAMITVSNFIDLWCEICDRNAEINKQQERHSYDAAYKAYVASKARPRFTLQSNTKFMKKRLLKVIRSQLETAITQFNEISTSIEQQHKQDRVKNDAIFHGKRQIERKKYVLRRIHESKQRRHEQWSTKREATQTQVLQHIATDHQASREKMENETQERLQLIEAQQQSENDSQEAAHRRRHRLDVLSLKARKLTYLPEQCSSAAFVETLPHLTAMDLSDNHFRCFPPIKNDSGQRSWLFWCTSLRYVDLSRNALGRDTEIQWASTAFDSLRSLEILKLTRNKIQTIPKHLFALQNLRKLNLAHNELRKLPDEIGSLKQLNWLNLSHNFLETLPAKIGNLDGLVQLNLSSNHFATLPESVFQCKHLQQLDMSWNKIVRLPCGSKEGSRQDASFLCELILSNNDIMSLHATDAIPEPLCSSYVVNLSRNQLSRYPIELCRPTFVSVLDISHNHLSEIASAISLMKRLKVLIAAQNHITQLDETISNLKLLVRLDVSANGLQELPREIGCLPNLQVLDVSRNCLCFLPATIAGNKSLTCLDVSMNKLESLPDSFHGFNKLTQMNLSSNLLECIPCSVQFPATVEILDLSNNKLSEVPELQGLQRLEVLRLSSNQLSYLPQRVEECSNLRELDISCNPIKAISLALGQFLPRLSKFIIDEKLPRRSYYWKTYFEFQTDLCSLQHWRHLPQLKKLYEMVRESSLHNHSKSWSVIENQIFKEMIYPSVLTLESLNLRLLWYKQTTLRTVTAKAKQIINESAITPPGLEQQKLHDFTTSAYFLLHRSNAEQEPDACDVTDPRHETTTKKLLEWRILAKKQVLLADIKHRFQSQRMKNISQPETLG